MLINGQKVNVPFKRDIVIPRVDADVVFTAIAISCEDEFNELCPQPEPPKEMDAKTNKLIGLDYDNPKFKKKYTEWHKKRIDHQILHSLENVKWETVDLEDPETWGNWRKECSASGLSHLEISSIINDVLETQQPSAELIEKMREDFLAGEALPATTEE